MSARRPVLMVFVDGLGLGAADPLTNPLAAGDFPARIGCDVPLAEPGEAGGRAAAVAGRYDFTLFEYFITDWAGHRQEMDYALEVLGRLDRFVEGILRSAGPDLTLVVASDHGNVEDLGTGTHTLNPVPTLVWGAGAGEIGPGIERITDVCPRILGYLGVRP